jgi:hypothetical protein
VLRLIAGGNANKEIAAQLSLTEETVKGHVKNILANAVAGWFVDSGRGRADGCRGAMSLVLSHASDPWMHVRLGALGAALAMLGPGAWSVDARLFGRKRIEISGQ